MHTITLYAKAGCHLCDEAREALEVALSDRRDHLTPTIDAEPATADNLALDEVDIRRDPALFERYRYRIPVIVVDGVERLEGRIAADEIAELVDSIAW
jgi:glutaredoxin